MNALNRTIYLDYGAATPLDPCVRDAMAPYEGELFYNPSAAYDEARRVRADLEGARASIAHLIGARAGNVVFTAGATEANNLAFAALPADNTFNSTVGKELFGSVYHCFLHLRSSSLRLGPSFLTASVNSFIVAANFAPSAADTHSTLVRSLSIPRKSSILNRRVILLLVK